MRRKLPNPEARRILARVNPSKSFWLCTNQNLKSLTQVATALKKVDNEVFRYHVSRDKNDFEVWIRDVIKDRELAREISRVKTKETLIRKISERVEILSKSIEKSKKVKPVKKKTRKAPVKKRKRARKR